MDDQTTPDQTARPIAEGEKLSLRPEYLLLRAGPDGLHGVIHDIAHSLDDYLSMLDAFPDARLAVRYVTGPVYVPDETIARMRDERLTAGLDRLLADADTGETDAAGGQP